MIDVGQRGIKVDKVSSHMVHITRQSICTREDTLDDFLTKGVVALELIPVGFVAWGGSGVVMLDGILTVCWYHSIEREA